MTSGEVTNIIESAKDNGSIKKYGLLKKTITVNDKDESQSRQSAKTLLKDLNRVLRTSSIKLLGNDTVKAGKLIALHVPEVGLLGNFKVKSINHAIASSIYTMSLSIEGV